MSVVKSSVASTTSAAVSAVAVSTWKASISKLLMMGSKLEFRTASKMGSESAATLLCDTMRIKT